MGEGFKPKTLSCGGMFIFWNMAIDQFIYIFYTSGNRAGSSCNYGVEKTPMCHGFGKVCTQSPSKMYQIFTCVCEFGYVGSTRTCEGNSLIITANFSINFFKLY